MIETNNGATRVFRFMDFREMVESGSMRIGDIRREVSWVKRPWRGPIV